MKASKKKKCSDSNCELRMPHVTSSFPSPFFDENKDHMKG